MNNRILSYVARDDLLSKRIILITGAADGIGRAVSKSFAQHGARLVLLDKKSRKLETLYDEITASGWPEPTLVVQDLAQFDNSAAQNISAGVEHDFQRLDGILHNAGHFTGLTPLPSVDPDAWTTTLQVNLTAPYRLTRALMPLLRLSDSASILFTSAKTGRRGRAYWGAYAAAYGGIETLMQVWADEVEQNTTIRINTIDPGAVRTGMRNLAYPGEVAESVRSADDITPAYLYLMGDDGKHVRGQAITIE